MLSDLPDNSHHLFSYELQKRELNEIRSRISKELDFEWSGIQNDYSLQLQCYGVYLDLIHGPGELKFLGSSAYVIADPNTTLHCVASQLAEGVFECTMMSNGEKIYRHTLCGGKFMAYPS